MKYTLFGDFGVFYIKMFDEDNKQIATYSINCTSDQVVEMLKIHSLVLFQKLIKRNMKTNLKKVVTYSLMIIQDGNYEKRSSINTILKN